jgi:hypothetical protein
MEPPKIDKVEKVFQKYYDDIQIVVDLMVSLDYEVVIIDSDGRTGLVNTDGYHFESVEVALDTKTEETINRLLSEGYEQIVKNNNTIQFRQWSRFNDVGCGIAYSINSVDKPEIQYLTELTPLGQDGWYYYVDDVNQWRLENTVAQGSS